MTCLNTFPLYFPCFFFSFLFSPRACCSVPFFLLPRGSTPPTGATHHAPPVHDPILLLLLSKSLCFACPRFIISTFLPNTPLQATIYVMRPCSSRQKRKKKSNKSV